MEPTLTLAIEKPAAGGRMLARHGGQIVLVDGAIPGERVTARVERVGKGVVFARAVDVLEPSPDRRAGGDRRCGGNLFAHILYPRQLQLKGEIILDAFARIAHLPLPARPPVMASPETGYRTRARLHVRAKRLGFFREASHEVCDAVATGQLLAATGEWIASAAALIAVMEGDAIDGIELAENLNGSERACHLELRAGTDPRPFVPLAEGLQGLSAQAEPGRPVVLAGTPTLSDVLHTREGDPASALRLRRDVRSFFQGNRYLLEPLLRHVVAHVPDGPVIDLYAGVGLFGLSLASAGYDRVTAVEGDPTSGHDLEQNAEAFVGRVRVARTSVEAFLGSGRVAGNTSATVIVDPPRTGLSKHALAGITALAPKRIVYVSCDVATLARDVRAFGDAGYGVSGVTGIDLFPNTAHVETVAVLE